MADKATTQDTIKRGQAVAWIVQRNADGVKALAEFISGQEDAMQVSPEDAQAVALRAQQNAAEVRLLVEFISGQADALKELERERDRFKSCAEKTMNVLAEVIESPTSEDMIHRGEWWVRVIGGRL